MSKLNVYMLFIALLMLGCSPKATEEDYFKAIIARYNNSLIEAHRSQFFEPLSEVATDEAIKRIDIMVSSYLQGNQLMEAELHRIDYKDIKVKGDKATVRTSEDWSYRWIDYKTGKEVEPLKDIHYEMLYYLIKKDGRWLVEKAEEKGSKAASLSVH